MQNIIVNLQNIQQQIKQFSQKSLQPVKLLAVSKTHPLDAILTAHQAGQVAFGENYVQEAIQKIQACQQANIQLEWHFIGHLQTNKSKDVAIHFDWVQTIDRFKLAQRLDAQRPDNLPALQVLLQVNISEEASKSGITNSSDELFSLAEQVLSLKKLNLRGLMAIPAPLSDDTANIAVYEKIKQLFDALKQRFPQAQIDTLSIGMTDDMQIAIEHGSTMVRVGTAIFGARDYTKT